MTNGAIVTSGLCLFKISFYCHNLTTTCYYSYSAHFSILNYNTLIIQRNIFIFFSSSKNELDSFDYETLLVLSAHCPKNNLNLSIKSNLSQLEQMQYEQTLFTFFWQRSQTYTVATTQTVAGSVFMPRFRLFSGQCRENQGQFTGYRKRFCIVYTYCTSLNQIQPNYTVQNQGVTLLP